MITAPIMIFIISYIATDRWYAAKKYKQKLFIMTEKYEINERKIIKDWDEIRRVKDYYFKEYEHLMKNKTTHVNLCTKCLEEIRSDKEMK